MSKVKLIFVGEGGVGKTCLISQYMENKFNEEHAMTVGRDKSLKEIEINGKTINLEIWDTPGQEKFNSASKMFMKNTKIALIVYSIIDKNSFKKLDKWIDMVNETNKNENVTIGIVANKSDLFEKQEVSKEEGEQYAKDKNLLFFETSAKDYASINNVFIEICKAFLEKNANSSSSQQNNKDDKQNNNKSSVEPLENDVNLNDIDKKPDCSSKCSII
jgi:small GTP-binding protein